ncbi:MAG TPA: CHAP domain-containing protein [Bacteroidia bacterium]
MKISKRNKIILGLVILLALSYSSYRFIKTINPNPNFKVGQKLDSLNGVYVYYNGGVDHVEKRNLTPDGYNLGLKYQCVEFVKRYYYEHYKHKMPDSYGNAKDFFDPSVKDGDLSKRRNLYQSTNPSKRIPVTGDLIVMDGHSGNPYGHVAIVSGVNVVEGSVEIIQQNPGPFAPSRVSFGLTHLASLQGDSSGTWKIESERILGWLSKKEEVSSFHVKP